MRTLLSSSALFVGVVASGPLLASDEPQMVRSTLSNGFASVETHCAEGDVQIADRGGAYGLNCEVDGKRVTLLDVSETLWLSMSPVGGFDAMIVGLRADDSTTSFQEGTLEGFPYFRALSVTEKKPLGVVGVRVGPDRLVMLMVRSEDGKSGEWVEQSFGPIADSLQLTGSSQ